ncbi:MAG: glutamate mutase L, partial [Eubacteriales bacterium]|nr:glutamate mutase L [Eubacteriales bacterium]
EMRLIFADSKAPLYIVENVYPKIDDLNVEPARKIIQDAFEDHIIQAPGMEHVRDMVNGPIIPTPGAVMECAKLLYDCIGDLVVLDVGGATTDLHSVTVGSEEISRILVSPEPVAKRTVEGDLGVYVNMRNIVDIIGRDKLAEELQIDIDRVMETYNAVPENEDEVKFVERLALEAVLKATERHAGRIRYVYGPSGRNTLAEGKDLTQVKYIIGTGGALTRLPHRVEMMGSIAKHNENGLLLFPNEEAKILVDDDYIMATLGVLSKNYRQAAIYFLEKSLKIKLK